MAYWPTRTQGRVHPDRCTHCPDHLFHSSGSYHYPTEKRGSACLCVSGNVCGIIHSGNVSDSASPDPPLLCKLVIDAVFLLSHWTCWPPMYFYFFFLWVIFLFSCYLYYCIQTNQEIFFLRFHPKYYTLKPVLGKRIFRLLVTVRTFCISILLILLYLNKTVRETGPFLYSYLFCLWSLQPSQIPYRIRHNHAGLSETPEART